MFYCHTAESHREFVELYLSFNHVKCLRIELNCYFQQQNKCGLKYYEIKPNVLFFMSALVSFEMKMGLDTLTFNLK